MNNSNSQNTDNSIPDFPKLPKDVLFPEKFTEDICPWLDSFIEFAKERSPRSFDGYYAPGGFLVLSAIANGRVIYDFGGRQTTSMYLLFVGKTTIYAKTTLARIIKGVIKEVGLSQILLPDTLTAQKMISMMSFGLPKDFATYSEEKKKQTLNQLGFAGQRCWISNEFGTILADIMRTNSVNAMYRGILRDLSDNDDFYTNGTLIRGEERIDHPYLSVLGCITPDDIAPFAGKGTALWGDGFLARFHLISPPRLEIKRGRFPRKPLEYPPGLIEQLRKWNHRLGFPEVTATPNLELTPAKGQVLYLDEKTYDAFYDYLDALTEMIPESDNGDMGGNYGRFPIKALQYAVLMASLDGRDKVTINYWAKAQEYIEMEREYLHYLYYQLTKRVYLPSFSNEEKIKNFIIKNGFATSRKIQSGTHILARDVQEVLDKLVDSGWCYEKEVGKEIRYFPTIIS